MAAPKLSESPVKPARSSEREKLDTGVVAIDFGAGGDLNIPSQLRLERNHEITVQVTISHIEPDAFEVHSRAQFPTASRVELLFRGEFVGGDVLYCRAENDSWVIGVQAAAPHTLRRELRYPCDWRATLTLAESDSRVIGRIIDYSRSGLGIASPIELPVGSQVAVEFDRGTVFGEVRYCTGRPGYYRVGLRAF